MAAKLSDMISFWKEGIALDKAVSHFSSKRWKEAYRVHEEACRRWQEEYDSLDPAEREREIQLEIGDATITTMVSNTSTSVFHIDLFLHEQRVQKAIQWALTSKRMIATGYSLPRTPTDQPQIIPVDLWPSEEELPNNVNWSKSEVKGNGLHFISVRLICSDPKKHLENKSSKTKTVLQSKKRQSELHECIGKVINELEKKNKSFPGASRVWASLKEKVGEDGFECIQSMDCDQEKKEDAIYWVSMAGIEQRMLKSRFLNVVSEFKTGRKTV